MNTKKTKNKLQRKRFRQSILTVLASIVVFVTTYAMIIPAITWEKTLICELEEHVHTEDCYNAKGQLKCGKAEHKHTDACFDAPKNLEKTYICGKTEHTHTEDCYFSDGTLKCTLQEHRHEAACFNPRIRTLGAAPAVNGALGISLAAGSGGVSSVEPGVYAIFAYDKLFYVDSVLSSDKLNAPMLNDAQKLMVKHDMITDTSIMKWTIEQSQDGTAYYVKDTTGKYLNFTYDGTCSLQEDQPVNTEIYEKDGRYYFVQRNGDNMYLLYCSISGIVGKIGGSIYTGTLQDLTSKTDKNSYFTLRSRHLETVKSVPADVTVRLFNYGGSLTKKNLGLEKDVLNVSNASQNEISAILPFGNNTPSVDGNASLPIGSYVPASHLNANGMPQGTLNGTTYDFDKFFNGEYAWESAVMNNGGGLFQQDADGYYYYDCTKNAASYNPETNSFDLYNATLFNEFYPWNRIDGHSYPYSAGTDLKLNGSGADARDFWFGLTLDFNMTMPQSGQMHGKDTIFDFSGDDDVLVYIDGVLVLDISGIHVERDGHINFTDGTVEDHPSSPEGVRKRTLKDIFGLEGDTFEPGSKHTLKMFYLERGGDSSNLKIKFNFTSKPDEPGEAEPGDIGFRKYEKETSATGIEGAGTGTENVHTICLDVVPPKKSDSIGVLLVMDTTSSMTVNCVTCGVSSDYHPGGSKYNPANPFAYWHWDGTWDTYAVCNDFASRKEISEAAAFAFIDKLATLSENTDNVYVRIVPFGGTATIDYSPWIDLTKADGVAAAKEKIRDLPKISNTNISAGLRGAYDILSGTLPEGLTSENTYIVMMTDGSQSISDKANLPEELLNDEAFLNKWLNIWSNYDHFERIENENIDIGFYIGSPYYAELIRDKDGLGSHLYTVMLGNNIDHGTKSGGDKNQKYNPGIGIDSKDFMASFSDYSTMVTTADGMTAYYNAVLNTLSSSLEDITVTDPMSDYVDFLTFTDSDGAQAAADAATYDLQTRTITWNPKDAAPDEDGHYRLYYNVRLKTEKSGYVAGQSYPANGTTTAAYTLKYPDNHTEKRTKDAVVPTLTGGALGQLSFTKISEDGDPITGAQFKLVHDDDCSYCSGATVSDIPFASGVNGIATAIGIPSGHTYKLYETAAPEGYRPFEGALRVTVSYGEVTVIGSEGIWKKEGNVYYLIDPKEKDIGGPFYVVSQDKDYPTLQEAIDAAAATDTIKVRPCSEFEVTEYDSSYATNIPDYIGDDGGEAYAEGKSLTFTSYDPDEPATLKDFAIVLEGSTTSKHNYTFSNLKFTGSSIIILDNFEANASFGTITVNGCYADTCTSTHNRALLKYPTHNLGETHSSSAFLQWVQYPKNRDNNGTTDALVFTGNTVKGTLHPTNPGDQKYTCFINGGAGPGNVTITGNTFGDYAHSKSTFGIVFQTMSNNADIQVSNNTVYMATKGSHFVWLGQFYPLERNGISVNVNNNNIYTGSSMANPPTRPYNLNSDKTVATPSFNVVYVSNTLNGTAVTHHNYVNGYCYNNIKISVNSGYSFIANQQIGHTDDERIQEVPDGFEKFNDIYLFGKAEEFTGEDHHDRDIGTDHYCIYCDELIELKNLTVTKEVIGCETNEEFEFTASVTGGTFRESGAYTVNADGTVTFRLKHGDSITLITDKKANVTVRETAAAGFYTQFVENSASQMHGGSSYSIAMTDDRSITVVNTFGVELPETGGIGTPVFYAIGTLLTSGALITACRVRHRRKGQGGE